MKYFKTPKGTDLPLLDLRGKPYLQVAHRVVWFREEHPDWVIKTTVEPDFDKQRCISRAEIYNNSDHLIACGTKVEDAKGFQDYVEKSETGAIGRALALCGYGTQFAPEFDEGERLADAPIQPAKVTPQWTKEQMREYSHARWNVDSAKALDITKLDELAALSKSKPFRVAMNDLGEQK